MRVGFAAIIGIPNVGKSTLMNQLIGEKIAITSNKPQTTRYKIQTILTNEEGQIVFLDTPGMHKAKNKLGKQMMKASGNAIKDVDVILWMVEPKLFLTEMEENILERIKDSHLPTILIINKTDSVEPQVVYEAMEFYHSQYDFSEIVPTSALRGKNHQELVQTIMKYLPEGELFYDEDTLTDQPVKQIVSEMIREKALHKLSQEIPYGLAVLIDSMKTRASGKIVDIDATIICERDSHKGMIIGKQGQMLKSIGSTARYEIERFLNQKVNLQLWVKVKKDWRESDYLIRNFGLEQE